MQYHLTCEDFFSLSLSLSLSLLAYCLPLYYLKFSWFSYYWPREAFPFTCGLEPVTWNLCKVFFLFLLSLFSPLDSPAHSFGGGGHTLDPFHWIPAGLKSLPMKQCWFKSNTKESTSTKDIQCIPMKHLLFTLHQCAPPTPLEKKPVTNSLVNKTGGDSLCLELGLSWKK